MDDDNLNIEAVIIESTISDAEMLGIILGKSGFKIRLFDDPFKAIDSLRIDLPDIIVVNSRLAKMSGYELCQRIKSDPLTSYLPVVMLTSINSREEMEKIFRLGASDMLIKPFRFGELSLRLKKIVNERQIL